MNKIVLGCVADDFTGASDAASFFVKEGIKTYLFNGVPKADADELLCGDEKIVIVIALKTRTADTHEAVSDSLEAFDWLVKKGARQLFIKYCSTFDSTKEGNIGPIIDSVLEKYNIKHTIICPAFPLNGRTVKNGHLYLNGVPLNETHMKDHPLTPMWDSDLSKLMEPQGKYPCLNLDYKALERSNKDIIDIIKKFGADKSHFYILPDYMEEQHAEKIIDLFGDLFLLTGGSGLMTHLGRKYLESNDVKSEILNSKTAGKAIILSGSCSRATLSQVEYYKKTNLDFLKINPEELARGIVTYDSIWEKIEEMDASPVLLYTSDSAENVRKVQGKYNSKAVSELLEQMTAYIAKEAVQNGYSRIIVAGGETSGAVTKALGYESYIVGDSIALGVPVLIPLKNKDIRLVLKSGNFGQDDFFMRALEFTGENVY